MLAVAAIAAGASGWLRREATIAERVLSITAGPLLLAPAAWADLAGAAVLAATWAPTSHVRAAAQPRRRRSAAALAARDHPAGETVAGVACRIGPVIVLAFMHHQR